MKRYVLVLIILGLLLAQPGQSSITPDGVYGKPPREGEPIVTVKKWVSEDLIKVGNNITVYVNITNWSDADAYNLTITEPIFNNWSRSEFIGYEKYEYTKLGSNASISYQYTMSIINPGNYTIEQTVINFVNINGSKYQAYSSYIPLIVYLEQPIPDQSDEWLFIFWWSAAFVAIPAAVLLYKRMK